MDGDISVGGRCRRQLQCTVACCEQALRRSSPVGSHAFAWLLRCLPEEEHLWKEGYSTKPLKLTVERVGSNGFRNLGQPWTDHCFHTYSTCHRWQLAAHSTSPRPPYYARH